MPSATEPLILRRLRPACIRPSPLRLSSTQRKSPALGGGRAGFHKGAVMKDTPVSLNSGLTALADELLELESETFTISDYADASEAILASCSSSATTSTCSSCCSC